MIYSTAIRSSIRNVCFELNEPERERDSRVGVGDGRCVCVRCERKKEKELMKHCEKTCYKYICFLFSPPGSIVVFCCCWIKNEDFVGVPLCHSMKKKSTTKK
mmetsp:Transcript_30882/g.34568  ORF Transcript_30882/g.34568 Transcript_30882/m.34568 type:complete len:102 (+) Transcript_30882:295-600(+)